jgi:hypothetical protein
MRLFVVRFGYIVVFLDDIREYERTIWGRGGPSPTGPRYRGPAGGRGGPNPVGPRCHGPSEEREGHEHLRPHCHCR